ncbi:hypothetical protein IV203_003997 [Nitzschia inconspicua]|uniref:Uncharacterized protein n=1 Tax=Nitzschia inconspicua TaxID=303405 RepID=A0A9K3PPQ6_9STRA|nr:hypothetical protein IV203_003997 [Nitzschia inconspicua]
MVCFSQLWFTAATAWMMATRQTSAWMIPPLTTKIKVARSYHPSPLQTRYPHDIIRNDPRAIITTNYLFRNSDGDEMDDENISNDDNIPSSPATTPILERLQVAGVSVSPKGFHVILQRPTSSLNDKNVCDPSPSYLPIKVTNDPSDAFAATSPESLTLCQLLSGVDMAGAILPPELLSKLVVYHIEEKRQQNNEQMPLSEQEQAIWDALQKSLSNTSQDSYKDAHVWFQNRIKLPQITLDQLTLVPSLNEKKKLQWKCRLECALPEWKERLVLPNVQPDILSSLAFQHDPETSLLFTCIALALRYKAPIVLEQVGFESGNRDSTVTTLAERYTLTLQELNQAFPQRTTVGKLQQQSTRVAENIERGFEIHKLQGALTIAMKLGDQEAAKRIRDKLDEYDSMQDLPTTASTTTTATSDTSNSKGDEEGGSLDDLDKNILQ